MVNNASSAFVCADTAPVEAILASLPDDNDNDNDDDDDDARMDSDTVVVN